MGTGTTSAFDAAVDRAVERIRGSRGADALFYTVSALGDRGMIWAVIAATQAARAPARRARTVRMLAASGVASAVVNRALKARIERPRPAFQGEHPLPIRVPTSGSFPSGHTLAAFCAAPVFARHDRWPAFATYLSLATLIGISRVYVRMHHASDVVGGAVIGVVLGLGIRAILRRLSPQ